MMNSRSALFLMIAAATLPQARGGRILNELSMADRAVLAKGEAVVMSENVEGAPWPRLSLYQVVDASPDVVWNLFTDYESASVYTPNLIEADVVSTEPDGSKVVKYTVKVPVLGHISYTVRNSYKQTKSFSEVKWTLLQSPLAKSSDGSLRIEPYGDGETLMCYTNLVVPITNLVTGLRGQALKEAKKTVKAIQGEAERRAGLKK